MKPKFAYTTAAEIPDALKDHYVEQDGKFVLDVEGAVPSEKLASFRDNNITLQKTLKDLNDKFNGIDPEEARKLLAIKADLDAEKLMKKEGIDAVVKERTGTMQKEHETKLATIQAERDKAVRELERFRIESQVLTEGAKAGLRPTATPDLVSRAMASLGLHEGRIVVRDSGGAIRYGSTGAEMTVTEWMAELVKSAGHLFEPNGGGGSEGSGNKGGAGTGGNPWDPKTFNVTKQGEIYKADKPLARKLAAQHGVILP